MPNLSGEEVARQLDPNTPAHIRGAVTEIAATHNLRGVKGGGDYTVDFLMGPSTFGRWDNTDALVIVEAFKHSWTTVNTVSVTYLDKKYTKGRTVAPDGTTTDDPGGPSGIVKLDDRVRVTFTPTGTFTGFSRDLQSNSPGLNTVDANARAIIDGIAFFTNPQNWARVALFVAGMVLLGMGLLRLSGGAVTKAVESATKIVK